MQPISSSTIGGAGGDLGYGGINPSVGVEFDTFQNSTFGDISSNHVGVDRDGSLVSLVSQGVTPRWDDENMWFAWIDYDGTTLEVRANQTGIRPVDPVLSVALDIPAIVGANEAFVGFTAATGRASGNHDLISWTYSDQFVPPTTTTTTLPPLCGAAPDSAASCKGAAVGKSLLQIRDTADDTKDQVKWKWKGAATTVGEFLDPVGSAAGRHGLCVYDASTSPQPLGEAEVAAQGTCGTASCWKATGATGFKYKNKAGNADGVTDEKLKAGSAGAARVQAKLKGTNVDTPAPPLTLPVTVQLVIDDGVTHTCWQTVYTVSTANEPGRFTAKGP